MPVSSLQLVSRYSGAPAEAAPLHQLGSGQWEKAKSKAAKQVRDTAADLLALYARRALRQGHAFQVKGHDYDAFGEGFPFEETPDQDVRELAEADETEFPEGRAFARRFGHRTSLAAPLLREGVPLGAIMVRRKEAQPFSDKQIELLKTFADQAVIAIENVRLFKEIQERTRELEQSLEEVYALSEVSRTVSSSLDLGQVLHEISEQAATLCDADAGFIQEYIQESKTFHISASWNAAEDFVRAVQAAQITLGKGAPDVARSLASQPRFPTS